MQETDEERRKRVADAADRLIKAGTLKSQADVDKYMADNGVKPRGAQPPAGAPAAAPSAPEPPAPRYAGEAGTVGPTAEAAAALPPSERRRSIPEVISDITGVSTLMGGPEVWKSKMAADEAERREKLGRYFDPKRPRYEATAILANIPGADDVVGGVNKLFNLDDPDAFQEGRHMVHREREAAKANLGGLSYGIRAGAPIGAAALAAATVPGGQALLPQMLMGGTLEGARRFGQAGSHNETFGPSAWDRGKEGLIGFGLGAGVPAAFAGGAAGAGWLFNSAVPQVARGVFKTPIAGPLAQKATASVAPFWQRGMRNASEFVENTLTPELQAGVRAFANSPAGAKPSWLEKALGSTGNVIARTLEPKDPKYMNRIVDIHLPGEAHSGAEGFLKAEAAAADDAVKATQVELGAVGQEMKEVPGPVNERVKGIIDRLTGRAKEFTETGKAAERVTAQQWEADAAELLETLKKPGVDANVIRETIATARKEMGEQLYPLFQTVRAPATPPLKLYGLIKSDKDLLRTFKDAADEHLSMLRNKAAEGLPATAPLPNIRMRNVKVGKEEMPEMNLAMFDKWKQRVNESVDAFFSGGQGGIPAAKGHELKKRIAKIEEEYLSLHNPADVAKLTAARGDWRSKSEMLEALNEGMNVQKYTHSTAGDDIAKGGPRDIDEFAKMVRDKFGKDPQLLRLFQIGGKASISGVLKDAPAREVATLIGKLVGSETAKRRTTMIYGPQMVAELESYLPEAIERTAGAFAGPTLARAALQTDRIPAVESAGQRQIAKLLAPLEARQAGLASTLAGQQAVADEAGTLAGIPFSGLLRGGPDAETAAKVTIPKLIPSNQQRVADITGGVAKSELSGLSSFEILERLKAWGSGHNKATEYLFGAMPNEATAAIKAWGPVRKANRAMYPYLTGRAAGGAVDATQGGSRDSQAEIETINKLARDPAMIFDDNGGEILPPSLNGPVSSADAGRARPSDTGVYGADTTKIYAHPRSGRRVVDTDKYTYTDAEGVVHRPTHAIEGVSGRRDGESWRAYEDRILDPNYKFASDVLTPNRSLDALAPDVAEGIRALQRAAANAGFRLDIRETKRSTERQEYLFQEGRTRLKGQAPSTYTLTSNHADDAGADITARSLRDGKESDAGYRWLHENAPKYGLSGIGWWDKGHIERDRGGNRLGAKADSSGRREAIPMKASDVKNNP